MTITDEFLKDLEIIAIIGTFFMFGLMLGMVIP